MNSSHHNDSELADKIVKNRVIPEPIVMQDLEKN